MSFSLDLSGMIDYAASFFNSLTPIIVIVGGLALGMTLIVGVLKLVQSLRFG
jgi:hypothetical protein